MQIAYEQQQQIERYASEAKYITWMRQFLDSDDPILVAAAIAWAKVHPGVLD